MSSTTFADLQEPTIKASWLNEVDASTHNMDGTAVRTSLQTSRYYGPTAGTENSIFEQSNIAHKFILDASLTNTSLCISQASGTGTGGLYSDWFNNGGELSFGVETSTGNQLASGSLPYSSFFGSKAAQATHLIANGVVSFSISADGIPYGEGALIHNNVSGAFTGSTNGYVCSGTYTPVMGASSNVSAHTFFAAQWMRVGNVVTVSGLLEMTCTAASTTTSMDWDLPIASNFAGNHQGTGTAVRASPLASSPLPAMILADPASNDIYITYKSDAVATSQIFSYTYTYLVI
jgi:hypothetical protein